MSTQRVRVWVAGLTIGGAVNKAQNSTVSAFLYAVSGTSDLLVVPSQYFYFARSLMTSDAMISPTTDGTNAVEPGMARRSVHLCSAPGGQMQ